MRIFWYGDEVSSVAPRLVRLRLLLAAARLGSGDRISIVIPCDDMVDRFSVELGVSADNRGTVSADVDPVTSAEDEES